MMNMIFALKVTSNDTINGDFKKTEHLIYGKDNACKLAFEIGVCDNVKLIDVMDTATGEIILTLEDKKITWTSDSFFSLG